MKSIFGFILVCFIFTSQVAFTQEKPEQKTETQFEILFNFLNKHNIVSYGPCRFADGNVFPCIKFKAKEEKETYTVVFWSDSSDLRIQFVFEEVNGEPKIIYDYRANIIEQTHPDFRKKNGEPEQSPKKDGLNEKNGPI